MCTSICNLKLVIWICNIIVNFVHLQYYYIIWSGFLNSSFKKNLRHNFKCSEYVKPLWDKKKKNVENLSRNFKTVFKYIEFVNECLDKSYFWKMLSNCSFKWRQKNVFWHFWIFLVLVAFLIDEHPAYSCYLIKHLF